MPLLPLHTSSPDCLRVVPSLAVGAAANFRTGGDLNDFLHGWLNYQVAARATTAQERPNATMPKMIFFFVHVAAGFA
eukprot:3187820-Pleurochrysis_carterae.AAC.1